MPASRVAVKTQAATRPERSPRAVSQSSQKEHQISYIQKQLSDIYMKEIEKCFAENVEKKLRTFVERGMIVVSLNQTSSKSIMVR